MEWKMTGKLVLRVTSRQRKKSRHLFNSNRQQIVFFRWFGCPLGLPGNSSADHYRNEWLYFDWFLLRWAIVIHVFFFLEEGWHCVFSLPALNLPVLGLLLICTPLSLDTGVPWWELCPFLSWAHRRWKDIESSFTHTLSLPGEKKIQFFTFIHFQCFSFYPLEQPVCWKCIFN